MYLPLFVCLSGWLVGQRVDWLVGICLFACFRWDVFGGFVVVVCFVLEGVDLGFRLLSSLLFCFCLFVCFVCSLGWLFACLLA